VLLSFEVCCNSRAESLQIPGITLPPLQSAISHHHTHPDPDPPSSAKTSQISKTNRPFQVPSKVFVVHGESVAIVNPGTVSPELKAERARTFN
jgi:hypothetical protein